MFKKKYEIIACTDIEKLENEVNDAITRGAIPLGSPQYIVRTHAGIGQSASLYIQAVVFKTFSFFTKWKK